MRNRTKMMAAVTAVAAASQAGLIAPNSTRQTLTSGQRGDRERGGAGRSGSPPFSQRGDAAPTDTPHRRAIYDSL